MLTSEEIEKITVELLTNRKPTIKGKEADEFRKKLKEEVEEIKKRGWIVEIPFEMLSNSVE